MIIQVEKYTDQVKDIFSIKFNQREEDEIVKRKKLLQTYNEDPEV